MSASVYLHMSRTPHEVGTVIGGIGKRPLEETEPHVEEILERRRPEGAMDRGQSIYLRQERVFNTVGLPYDVGYIHVVEPIGNVDQRDLSWIGVLQRRHHQNQRIRKNLSPHLSDEAIADCYWRGNAFDNPIWEWIAREAVVLAVDTEPSRVRPPSTFLDGVGTTD